MKGTPRLWLDLGSNAGKGAGNWSYVCWSAPVWERLRTRTGGLRPSSQLWVGHRARISKCREADQEGKEHHALAPLVYQQPWVQMRTLCVLGVGSQIKSLNPMGLPLPCLYFGPNAAVGMKDHV